MRQRNIIMAGALALAGLATAAVAATPADTIGKRQATFKAVGKAFKAINDEVKKPAPDVKLIQTNAADLHKQMGVAGGLFGKGTGPESGVKTAAKADIWLKWNDFKTAHVKAFNATNAFAKTAKGGNIDAIKAALPSVGGSCKGCHDQFRAKDQ